MRSEFPTSFIPEALDSDEVYHFIVFDSDDDHLDEEHDDVVEDTHDENDIERNEDEYKDEDVIEHKDEVEDSAATVIECDEIPEDDTSILSFKREESSYLHTYNLNSDGSLIVLGYHERLIIWDTTIEKIILEIKDCTESLNGVHFSCDSKYIVIRYEWHMEVWDIAKKSVILQYACQEFVWLLWHFSSAKLFAGLESGEIYMWQMPRGKCTLFPVNESVCRSGTLSPCGTKLAAGYEDGSIRVWDIHTGEIVSRLYGLINDNSESVATLSFSFDGHLLLAHISFHGPLILRTENCETVATIEPPEGEFFNFSEFCPDPDSLIIATGLYYAGVIKLWTLNSERVHLYRMIELNSNINRFLWSSKEIFYVLRPNEICMINRYTGEKIKHLVIRNSEIENFLLSKDMRKIIVKFFYDREYDIKLYIVDTSFVNLAL